MNTILAFVAGVGAAIVSPYLSHDALVFCAGVVVGAGGCGYLYEHGWGPCEVIEVIENQETDAESEQEPSSNNDIVVNEVKPEPTFVTSTSNNLISHLNKDIVDLSAYDLDTMQVSYTNISELEDGNFIKSACANKDSEIVHNNDINNVNDDWVKDTERSQKNPVIF